MNDLKPARLYAPRASLRDDPFWERWVPVLIPAGLALILAFALAALMLTADPSSIAEMRLGPGIERAAILPAPSDR